MWLNEFLPIIETLLWLKVYNPTEEESEYNPTPHTFTTTQQTPIPSTDPTHFPSTLPGHTATPTPATTLPTT